MRFWRAWFLATPSAPLRLSHHTRHALWPRRLSERVNWWQGWWACLGFLRRACLPRPNAAIPLPPCPRAGGLAAAESGRAVAWAGPSSLPLGGERARIREQRWPAPLAPPLRGFSIRFLIFDFPPTHLSSRLQRTGLIRIAITRQSVIFILGVMVLEVTNGF